MQRMTLNVRLLQETSVRWDFIWTFWATSQFFMVKASMIYLKHLSALDNNYPTELRTTCTVSWYKYISQVTSTQNKKHYFRCTHLQQILNILFIPKTFHGFKTCPIRLWDQHCPMKSSKLLTARIWRLHKVMLSVVSVILFTGGLYLMMHWEWEPIA